MKIIILSTLLLVGCATSPPDFNGSPTQIQEIPTGGLTDAPFGCLDGKIRSVQC